MTTRSRAFEHAISLQPDHADAHYNKARALDLLDETKEAISVYSQTISLDPARLLAYYYRGAALVRVGRFEDAIKSFDRALEIDPSHVDSLFDKGTALGSLGMYREAVKIFERVRSIDGTIMPVFISRKGVPLQASGGMRMRSSHLTKISISIRQMHRLSIARDSPSRRRGNRPMLSSRMTGPWRSHRTLSRRG